MKVRSSYCSASRILQARFDRAPALLYNFWYARALTQFQGVVPRRCSPRLPRRRTRGAQPRGRRVRRATPAAAAPPEGSPPVQRDQRAAFRKTNSGCAGNLHVCCPDTFAAVFVLREQTGGAKRRHEPRGGATAQQTSTISIDGRHDGLPPFEVCESLGLTPHARQSGDRSGTRGGPVNSWRGAPRRSARTTPRHTQQDLSAGR
jgi:hypothetical protein